MRAKGILMLLCIGTLSGCASTGANLQRESAHSIGGLTPDQVEVTDIKRGVTEVSWKANTPNGAFKCFADDMVRRVSCVQ